MAADSQRTAHFERLYTTMFPEIAGYVRRRCGGAEADDVIGQVFAVAWRRFDDIPRPPQDRLWLFGVARRALAEAERATRRRRRLGLRLAAEAIVASPSAAAPDPAAERVIEALTTLRAADREALRLVLWEALSHAEAAEVLGCTANAFEIRYRRARAAVRDQLMRSAGVATPDLSVRNTASVRGDAS